MAFMKLLDVIFHGVIDITRALDRYYYREVLIVNPCQILSSLLLCGYIHVPDLMLGSP